VFFRMTDPTDKIENELYSIVYRHETSIAEIKDMIGYLKPVITNNKVIAELIDIIKDEPVSMATDFNNHMNKLITIMEKILKEVVKNNEYMRQMNKPPVRVDSFVEPEPRVIVLHDVPTVPVVMTIPVCWCVPY